jgi:hypothetical protein
MADAPLPSLDPNGWPVVPTDPGLARARLAQIEADPEVVNALLDTHHPMHEQRTRERRGLQIIIARGS